MVNPLSRITMENFLKDKKPIISQRVDNKANKTNIDGVEEEIIKDLIMGRKNVIEDISRKTVITLDEAADRVKNNR